MKGTTAFILAGQETKTQIAMATLGVAKIEVDGLKIVITYNSGSKTSLTVPTPPKGDPGVPGVSVNGISINDQNHLICKMSDDSTIDAGEITAAGTTNYNNLNNLPTINGIEVKGNLTTKDLKLDNTNNNNIDKAIICIVDDDGTNRVLDNYTGLTTWLNNQDICMDFAICYDTIGTNGKLSVQDLKNLINKGNGVISHGMTKLQSMENVEAVETELKKAIAFLDTNSLINNKIYTYPAGLNDDDNITCKEVKEAVGKYFDYALNVNIKEKSSEETKGVWNTIPLTDNLNIARMEISDTKGLNTYKTSIDKAIESKGLVILFTHSFRSTFLGTAEGNYKDGQGYINFQEVITYLKAKDVEFLTVEKALKKIKDSGSNADLEEEIKELKNNKLDKEPGKSLVDDKEIERISKLENYNDEPIKESIKKVSDGLMNSVGYSADYKEIQITTAGGETKSINVEPIIKHAKAEELEDFDINNRQDGAVLYYNAATGKHEYKIQEDEKVRLNKNGNSAYLEDLLDKVTLGIKDGKLSVKNIDGLETSLQELNYIKGLTMPVQDLINIYTKGGMQLIEKPFNTKNDLDKFDTATLLDNMNYLCYVLVDETQNNHKTTYIVKKGGTPIYYGTADNTRDFSTNPINLLNEVTGKLGPKNIDTEALFKLIVLSSIYKTSTEENQIFSTHGAKAMYDELITAIKSKANDTDLQSHTNDTNIHVTTIEKEKWNKVDDKLDTLTYENNSKVHNIKTYTKLEQLGLVSGCKVFDIFNSMPDNAYCEIACNESQSGNLVNISDIPVVYGLLTIRKWDKTRFSIELKMSGGGTLAPNVMYIGQFKGNDGNSLSWKRVCTTTTDDIPPTLITFKTGYFSDDIKGYYEVRNGECKITFMNGTFLSTLSEAITAKTIATGLPIPSISQIPYTYSPWASNDKQIIMFVNNKGDLILHTSAKIANACVFTTFSYFVKEN